MSAENSFFGDRLPSPRANEVSLPIPVTQHSVAVLKVVLTSKGCSCHFMQIQKVSEQGNWRKHHILGSLLVMDEMQPWELGKNWFQLRKDSGEVAKQKTTGVRLQPGR